MADREVSGSGLPPARWQRQPGAPPGELRIRAESPAPQVAVIAYSPDEFREEDVADLRAIEKIQADWPVVWVNVNGLGDEGILRELGDMFGLHPLALEDVVNLGQRAKIEQYGQQLFMVTHMFSMGNRVETEQLSVFLGDGFVLTFQERPGDCLDPVRNRIRKGLGRVRNAGADYLAYAILDAAVDHCFPILDTYGDRLAGLEEQATAPSDNAFMRHIHAAKQDLLRLRRALGPQRDAVNALLRDEHPLIAPETSLYLRDCYDHVTRLIDTAEGYRELTSDLANIYMTAISNRMNAVMKVLTIIATIFIPLTFVAGVYGMNFKHMPELGWRCGYAAVLALMAVMAGGMIVFFRRKRWI